MDFDLAWIISKYSSTLYKALKFSREPYHNIAKIIIDIFHPKIFFAIKKFLAFPVLNKYKIILKKRKKYIFLEKRFLVQLTFCILSFQVFKRNSP